MNKPHVLARCVLAAAVAWPLLVQAQAQAQSQTLRVRLNADIRSTDPGVNRDFNTDGVVLHTADAGRSWRVAWRCSAAVLVLAAAAGD